MFKEYLSARLPELSCLKKIFHNEHLIDWALLLSTKASAFGISLADKEDRNQL